MNGAIAERHRSPPSEGATAPPEHSVLEEAAWERRTVQREPESSDTEADTGGWPLLTWKVGAAKGASPQQCLDADRTPETLTRVGQQETPPRPVPAPRSRVAVTASALVKRPHSSFGSECETPPEGSALEAAASERRAPLQASDTSVTEAVTDAEPAVTGPKGITRDEFAEIKRQLRECHDSFTVQPLRSHCRRQSLPIPVSTLTHAMDRNGDGSVRLEELNVHTARIRAVLQEWARSDPCLGRWAASWGEARAASLITAQDGHVACLEAKAQRGSSGNPGGVSVTWLS